jgi:hypothetical protein
MATAIPLAPSPVSAVAAAASTASPGRTVSAASTVSRVSTMQLGSAVSAPGSDIWVVLAGGNCSGTAPGEGRVDARPFEGADAQTAIFSRVRVWENLSQAPSFASADSASRTQ